MSWYQLVCFPEDIGSTVKCIVFSAVWLEELLLYLFILIDKDMCSLSYNEVGTEEGFIRNWYGELHKSFRFT